MKEHRNIEVQGKVKEIDFLYYTELFAIERNINGFIQNGSLSRIYIEAEADESRLDELEDYLKNSPLGLHVTSVNAEKGEVKDYKRFRVKYERRLMKNKKPALTAKVFRLIKKIFS
ncbi:MAG: acylphosphatase [Bacteroidales bacterium]